LREERVMPKDTKTLDFGLNALRGFAILLVVIYHAVLLAPPGSHPLYLEFQVFIRYMPLPLFTALSGYLYAIRRTERGTIGKSIRVKARRLLFPLFSATTLMLLMRAVMPGANQVPDGADVLRAYFFRFEHLWYLQALFLIFVVIALIDGFDVIQSVRGWFALLVVWSAVSLVIPLNAFFGYAGLVQLMPFFLFGYGLRRWPDLLNASRVTLLAWAIFLIGMLLLEFDFHGVLPLPDLLVERTSVLNLAAGCAFCFLCVRYRRDVPGLSVIGVFSFSIYIFHTIGMAVANRVAGLTPWDEGFEGLVTLKILLGVFLPILMELIIRRSAVLRTLFLGDTWKWQRPAFLQKTKSAPVEQ
jgi:peptidoglycan/LPS O-acetylase OafA/YrhL